MKNITIKFANVAEAITIMKILVSLGKRPYQNSRLTIEDYAKQLCREGWGGLSLYFDPSDGYDFCGSNQDHDYVWSVDSAKILDLVINYNPPIVIDNVGDYTASVSKQYIEVGCQKISHEKFQEIADAVKKVLAQ